MISRAQGKTWPTGVAVRKQQKLSSLDKAMLKWVVVDPEDRLLDASIGSGMMAEYLRRNMQCEVCGVSDNMEDVRAARTRLQNCDIVYAAPGDIPWRDNAFDTVILKYDGEEENRFLCTLNEVSRVLRPGGQLILGAVCYPAAVTAVASMLMSDTEEKKPFHRVDMAEMLSECDFMNVTWQRTGFGTGVMIAWKRKPEVNEIRDTQIVTND